LWALGVVAALDCLIVKLQMKFPTHGIMDSLGVVYSHYCLQFYVEKNVQKHLDVIKAIFCHPKKLGNSDIWVFEVLSTSLDNPQSLFKLTVKSNACATLVEPLDVNLLTLF
jgi:hypothetical protein